MIDTYALFVTGLRLGLPGEPDDLFTYPFVSRDLDKIAGLYRRGSRGRSLTEFELEHAKDLQLAKR